MLVLSVNNAKLRLARVLTVNTSEAFPVPPVLVARRVTVLVPTFVGVPEMTPLVSTLRPAGSPLALKEVGLFVAVIW